MIGNTVDTDLIGELAEVHQFCAASLLDEDAVFVERQDLNPLDIDAKKTTVHSTP